ncbi:MAG: hypothetical protein WC998_05730 [Candidatus Paceibacterota bacterium]|jgi:hypothetical protein
MENAISVIPSPLIEQTPEPLDEDPVIHLGAVNGSAVKRLANYVQNFIKNKRNPPRSKFAIYVAARITGIDKQDAVCMVTGRRGSGKSFSCLYLGWRISSEIALLLGGKWQNYFNSKNIVALEDSARIAELLNSSDKYQVILIDDASVAVGNRGWASIENRNFLALLTTCRVRRWCLLINAPTRRSIDTQIKDMVDFSFYVIASFHAGGFNVLKASREEISPYSGKNYTHKLSYDGTKFDYWVAFAPPKELVKEYDIVREEGAIRLNQRIVETGNFKPDGKKNNRERISERNLQRDLTTHGDNLRKIVSSEPDIALTTLASRLVLSVSSTKRMLENLGITLEKRKRGRY